MLTDLLLQLTNFITSTISAFGYLGVAVLMAIESAAIPLPSEVIMPFAGYLAQAGRFNLFNLAIAGALGSLIGSWVTYAIGYFSGRAFIVKYGRYFLISEYDLKLTDKFFEKFGSMSTFVGRMLPVVRTFISIPAGIGRVKLVPFSIYTFLGSFIWSYALAWIGLKLGQNWHVLETYFRMFDIVIVIVILVVIIWWIRRHFKRS